MLKINIYALNLKEKKYHEELYTKKYLLIKKLDIVLFKNM